MEDALDGGVDFTGSKDGACEKTGGGDGLTGVPEDGGCDGEVG